jgi:microcystin-dependent protein
MSEPFIAEIRIFSGNFAPTGWALCDGQVLPISQNTALFSLLGVNYGGNGVSTFNLPNLQGRVPMHPGQGPGLSLRSLGESGGSESVTLAESEIPNHSHALRAVSDPGDLSDPTGRSLARSSGAGAWRQDASSPVPMDTNAVAPAGGNQPHNNLMPYLALTFIIALQGIYPPRP